MKLIEPSFEIIEQKSGLDNMYRHIELCGRTCYLSYDKITEDSAKSFVDRMKSNHHLSVLEHGTVHLQMEDSFSVNNAVNEYFFLHNPYSKCVRNNYDLNITTNLRVLIENGKEDLLTFLCVPNKYHCKRVTVKFILPIGISREFCRHRAFSFSEMSTRYCNFSKGKFGEELTFIKDEWTNELLLKAIEHEYNTSTLEAQKKRNILPLCTKTELIMTGFIKDWEHFFELRCSPNAHPQAQELAIPLKEEFVKRNYINE